MEVHVRLENAFPGGIRNRRITFGYNAWFASHPSAGPGSLVTVKWVYAIRKKHNRFECVEWGLSPTY